MFKNESIRHLLAYAGATAGLVFLLKGLEWAFFVRSNAVEWLVGSVAGLFLFLGIWLAKKLTAPPTEKVVFIEIEKALPPTEVDQKALEKLGLSPREREVLEAIARGLSNAEIARERCLSLSTVKSHASNLFSKMDVKSRSQAIEKARRLRLIALKVA